MTTITSPVSISSTEGAESAPAQGSTLGVPTRFAGVDGALMFSNRGGGVPSHVDPEALAKKLAAGPYPFLAELLPSPTGMGTAIRAACSRRRKSVSEGGFEWREIAPDDAGNRVILLMEITSDPNALEAKASAKAAVLVSPDTGDAFGTTPNPVFQPEVDAFIESYRKERGVMGSAQLWATVRAVAYRNGDGFPVTHGQVYVCGETEQQLIEFDRALHALGSHYRVRHMPFVPEIQRGAFAEDAVATMTEEIHALRKEFEAKLARASEGGKAPRLGSMLSSIEELVSFQNRAKLMSRVMAAEAKDMMEMAEVAKNAAVAALTGGR